MGLLESLLSYELIGSVYIYVFLVGPLHAMPVGAAALALIPRLVLSGWARYFRKLRRFLLINALLLVFGILGNFVLMTFVYDRLYISQDTVVDFFPFIPFGQWALNAEWGGEHGSLLNGASLWQLRGLWALAASLVWVSTILVYRCIAKCRLPPRPRPLETLLGRIIEERPEADKRP